VPERSHDSLPDESIEDTADAAEPSLSPEVTERIGECLRLYYASMMTEPVPEHLIRLVDGLADKGNPSDES